MVPVMTRQVKRTGWAGVKGTAEVRGTETGDRGRGAESPTAIPARGWWDSIRRVGKEMRDDRVSVVAAGVAFYSFLSIFPGLAALVALWGFFSDPNQIEDQFQSLSAILPSSVLSTMQEQLRRLASQPGQTLGFGALAGILVFLWSASKGVKTLIQALNIAYDEDEKRGFVKRTVTILAFTLGTVAFGLLAVAAVVVIPALLGKLDLPEVGTLLVNWLRWPALALTVLLGLGVLYRYGPSRERAQWRWVSGGSAVAAALWLAASALFSFYVSHFGNYNQTYGSVAAVAILLTWFLISAYVVILGAELNAELEHQTARDTTRGAPEPMGQQGAHYADTVAEGA